MSKIKVGILALQGAFAEHARAVESLGAVPVMLREASDVEGIDALILPGGESTVQGKLLRQLNMEAPIKKEILAGLPVLATCAGVILLADHIENDRERYLGTLPVSVRRNAYGRQLASFMTAAPVEGFGRFDMTFIRAPQITKVSDQVNVLARVDGHISAVSYKNQVGLTFHPELGSDLRFHGQLLERAGRRKDGQLRKAI